MLHAMVMYHNWYHYLNVIEVQNSSILLLFCMGGGAISLEVMGRESIGRGTMSGGAIGMESMGRGSIGRGAMSA